mgnify:FL=1
MGISSLNEALLKNGFQKDFVRVFTDWVIAVVMNDCALGEHYCYKNSHLRDLRITPISYFLPRSETIFSTYHSAAPWSGNWHRLVGGNGYLILEFEGAPGAEFKVPYVLCDKNDNCSVGSFSLNDQRKGEIKLSGFGVEFSSLTMIPFVTGKTSGFNGREDLFSFSWKATVQKTSGAQTEQEAELRSQLLARISELQEQVRQLQVQLAALRGQQGNSAVSCVRFDMNLSFGMRNEQVRCLQEFLAAQGVAVYPEGLVTGNFLSLTRQAVIRFQEKYASDILAPFGLDKGTGYVGQMTRNKINQLLEFSTAMGS